MNENGAAMNDETIKRGIKEAIADFFGTKPEQPEPAVSRDEFAQMSAKLNELSAVNAGLIAERDAAKEAAKTAVDTMSARIAEVELARSNEHFSVVAREEFSHLPVETGELATNLRWLHEADADKAKFFTDLLKKADAKYSDAFKAKGGRGQAVSGSADSELKRKVDEYKASNPNASDADAMTAVMSDPANSALYEQYRAEVHNG